MEREIRGITDLIFEDISRSRTRCANGQVGTAVGPAGAMPESQFDKE
jgi:hypothetical protein